MSIIEDFASLNVELAKLEQAMAPAVKPDFSTTDTGDVTDEARKTYYGMFGYPVSGGVDDMVSCMAIAPGEMISLRRLA